LTKQQNKQLALKLLEQAGTPGRTRTLNLRFWRPLLYQLNYWRVSLILSSFLVQSVLAAPLAVFLHLDAIRIILLVLFGRVVTALALGARQSDQRTHEFSFRMIDS
jgi:hypothetical protein